MNDPILTAERTARFGLPLLHVGQAQKEATLNEALALADALLHPAVQGIAQTPPDNPVAGECWLVGPVPTGSWAGQADALACFQAGIWVFVRPRAGMAIVDLSDGSRLFYRDGWQRPLLPGPVSGGAVVDQGARDQIATVCAALRAAGLF